MGPDESRAAVFPSYTGDRRVRDTDTRNVSNTCVSAPKLISGVHVQVETERESHPRVQRCTTQLTDVRLTESANLPEVTVVVNK